MLLALFSTLPYPSQGLVHLEEAILCSKGAGSAPLFTGGDPAGLRTASSQHRLFTNARRRDGSQEGPKGRDQQPRKEGHSPQRAEASEDPGQGGGLGKGEERELGEVEISATPGPGAEEAACEPEEHEQMDVIHTPSRPQGGMVILARHLVGSGPRQALPGTSCFIGW